MTAPTLTPARAATSGWRAFVANPAVMWSAFVIVHFWLGMLNLYGPGEPFGDVTVMYRFWTDQLVVAHYRVGIDAAWVYPIVALLPMLAARAFGTAQYAATWLAMVMFLDAVAFAIIIGWGRRRQTSVAWWWLGFLLVLGPIALGRIDSISVPLAIVGALLVGSQPRTAVFILTIATWMKVWPVAIVAAIVIAARGRVNAIATAVLTSAAITGIALALGSGTNVFSFITEQGGRGLQIEAPVSAIWLWRQWAGFSDSSVYYDTNILTWQVRGAGVDVAAAVMTPVLVLAMVIIVGIGILAARNRAPVADVLPALSLALVTALIAFNKVGSPQYVTWLAVPVILGLATTAAGRGRSFRVPAILVAVIAGLTQLIYPYLYFYLLGTKFLMPLLITSKGILLFALLGWAVVSLVNSARSLGSENEPPEETEWLPSVWPFSARSESER